MSEYTLLTNESPPSSNVVTGRTQCSLRLHGWNFMVIILLVTNLVMWMFAAMRLSVTYHTLRKYGDMVETRFLVRPDILNGLEELVQVGGP